MTKYIDKDKIKEAIEKRYEYWREKEHNSHSIESEIRMSECQHLMLLFNTLEEKRVDLENEIHLWMEDNTCGGYCSANIRETAEHFFELGLKAGKGE